MKNKTDNLLWLALVIGLGVMLLGSQRPQVDGNPRPTRAGLSVILNAFAYNLEADGNRENPAVQYSNQLGEAFNVFGSRTTLGKSYKETFSDEFKALGSDLREVFGVLDSPVPLSPETRSRAVSVIRQHADGIEP